MTDLVAVDNFIEHAGVKGMKWGVRKSEDRVSKAPSAGKIRDTNIKAARKDIAAISKNYNNAGKDLRKAKRSKDVAGQESARKTMAKYNKEFADSPSRAVAVKMTRGELVASTILGGPLGLAGAAAITGGASAGIARGQRKRAGG